MQPADALQATLRRLDGRGYKAYGDLRGGYRFDDYELWIDRVQSDPFAPPSRVRVRVAQSRARLSGDLFSNRPRKIGLEDFLTRAFDEACGRHQGPRSTGHGGIIAIVRCAQEILERTAVEVSSDAVEARFFVGLPAFGRRIAGQQAAEMFFDRLLAIVRESLFFDGLDAAEVRHHVETCEDAQALRTALGERGLVAFAADGALLPRESGVSDRPMGGGVVAFESPESLRVTFDLPNADQVTGMGIPRGVTLIVGGGYHGKSTLLNALAAGVYDHIPGDGREQVVTAADAVKIRAEDGRFVEKVDISPFISNLPFGGDTSAFSTGNASGSTSQAANIIEAIQAGARLLLIDEDTSATNFMIRDERMQALVAKDKEPITPLIDAVRTLHDELGVSTLLVMGGSGDYFDVADTVVMMDTYRPRDVTAEAKAIAREHATGRRAELARGFGDLRRRAPQPQSLDATRRGRVKIKPRGKGGIDFGAERVDLSRVEQIVEDTQTRAIGWLMEHAAREVFDGKRTLADALDLVEAEIEEKGLLALMPYAAGDFARPRRHELAAAINRLRTLRCG